MNRKVLIAGAGQLGSRYLQGLSKYRQPLDVWVYDPAGDSLERARKRWAEVADAESGHTVQYVTRMTDLPDALDLAIVATTADVRPSVIASLVERSQVANWVLEKILAQSATDVLAIVEAIGSKANAWVNTPMHNWSLYRHLREHHPKNTPIAARFNGFRGLICNAIHYVDFVARWNNADITSIDTSGLLATWYPAQRSGFYETDGILALTFSDGSSLHMSSYREKLGYQALIRIGNMEWEVSERDGLARAANGDTVTGVIEFQSQMTTPLIESIFGLASCPLPTLAQSAKQHIALLAGLQEHWNATMYSSRGVLPVT
jgi:hypothetical protein